MRCCLCSPCPAFLVGKNRVYILSIWMYERNKWGINTEMTKKRDIFFNHFLVNPPLTNPRINVQYNT